MNAGMKTRMAIDMLMLIDLYVLMGFPLWGMRWHAAAGMGFFLLLLAHQGLNWRWYAGLCRGRWNGTRRAGASVNGLLLLLTAVLLWSSLVLGRAFLPALPRLGGMELGRALHLAGAYWGFLLMSVHLGLHFDMFKGLARRMAPAFPRKGMSAALRWAGAAIAVYGAWAFYDRHWAEYLFFRTSYAFFDPGEPAVLFYADHAAIMGCAMWLARHGAKALRRSGRRRVKGAR